MNIRQCRFLGDMAETEVWSPSLPLKHALFEGCTKQSLFSANNITRLYILRGSTTYWLSSAYMSSVFWIPRNYHTAMCEVVLAVGITHASLCKANMSASRIAAHTEMYVLMLQLSHTKVSNPYKAESTCLWDALID